jgi:hypothetical protein
MATLHKKLLTQIGIAYDIMISTKLKSNEYLDLKKRLDHTGLHLLKYLQKRTAGRTYLQNKATRTKDDVDAQYVNAHSDADADVDVSSAAVEHDDASVDEQEVTPHSDINKDQGYTALTYATLEQRHERAQFSGDATRVQRYEKAMLTLTMNKPLGKQLKREIKNYRKR